MRVFPLVCVLAALALACCSLGAQAADAENKVEFVMAQEVDLLDAELFNLPPSAVTVSKFELHMAQQAGVHIPRSMIQMAGTAEVQTETDSEADSDADAEADSESEAEAEADAESESESETDSESKSDLESEMESDAEAEAEVDSESDADSESSLESEMEADAESEVETELQADAVSDAASEVAAESGLDDPSLVEQTADPHKIHIHVKTIAHGGEGSDELTRVESAFDDKHDKVMRRLNKLVGRIERHPSRVRKDGEQKDSYEYTAPDFEAALKNTEY